MDEMDDDDVSRACPQCRLDKVDLQDILSCIVLSLRNIYIDIVDKRYDIATALTRDDRIFYVAGIFVLAVVIVCLSM